MQTNIYSQTTQPQYRVEDARPQEIKPTSEESFGFWDLLDMVNPLQHIPIVGTLYRELTGDSLKPISRIVGGAAFGGFVGAGMGIANTIAEHEFGDDVGSTALAWASGERRSYDKLPADMLAFVDLPQTALKREAERYNN